MTRHLVLLALASLSAVGVTLALKLDQPADRSLMTFGRGRGRFDAPGSLERTLVFLHLVAPFEMGSLQIAGEALCSISEPGGAHSQSGKSPAARAR